jgi:hypothetical protein
MSRTHTDNAPDRQPEPRTLGPERESFMTARNGLTREAARTEIDRFRGVAEYETRKLLGQRSALKQPSSAPAREEAPGEPKRKLEK